MAECASSGVLGRHRPVQVTLSLNGSIGACGKQRDAYVNPPATSSALHQFAHPGCVLIGALGAGRSSKGRASHR